MKLKCVLKTTIFILLLLFNYSVWANTTEEAQIQALTRETQALQTEVTELQQRLAEQTTSTTQVVKGDREGAIKPKTVPIFKTAPTKNITNYKTIKIVKIIYQPAPTPTLPSDVKNIYILGKNPVYIGGMPVVISPYLGAPPAYDASDLITNFSEINSDLLVLQERQTIDNVYENDQIPDPNSFLALSGTIEGQAFATRPYTGPRNSDLDLTTMNISALGGIGKWVSGLLSLDYDNLPPDQLTPPQLGPRTNNSRVYLDQGYFTIGNLNNSDLYATMGQIYVPFGSYGSFMINSPLTSLLAETQERAVLLGFSRSNNFAELDMQAFAYKGDSVLSVNSSQINEGGGNFDFLLQGDNWNTDIGSGLISNIADSLGMQLNGNPVQSNVFAGFANSANAEVLDHRVPGFDIHGSATVGPLNGIFEYITSTRAFAREDLSFNDEGARPQAFDIEASVKFNIYDKPSAVSLDYGYTKEALALVLPASEYAVTFSTSLWQSTVESIGFQHDINYHTNDFAAGNLLPAIVPGDRINLGQTSDSIIAQMDVYF